MSDELCYCPACIITRKGFGKAECLRDKKTDVGEDKDDKQSKLF